MNRSIVRPLSASALAAFFCCAPFAGDADEPPFDIAVIAPLTGPSAFLGKEEANAIEVLQNVVNKNGGIRGRQIRFTIQDDQSVAQNTVELLNGNIAKKATVIIGAATVATCGAMAPLIAKSGPVAYCFSPGIHPEPGAFMFSAGASTSEYITASIRYMRGKGWNKIALMTSNDATGQDAEKAVETSMGLAENQGRVTIVDREHFNTSDISVAAQISRIKASGAQAAIMWTTGTAFGTVLREASQSGANIPIITSAGNLNYAQLISYKSFMPDDLYMMAPPWAAPGVFPNRAVRNTVNAYLAAFAATGVKPDQGQCIAWDPAQLVLDAFRKLGFDAKPDAIRAFIASRQGWTGVNGVYDFKAIPQRGLGINDVAMVRWDKNKAELLGVSKPGGEPR